MPNYQPITQTDYTALRYKRTDNFLYASFDAVAPLVLQELPKACMSLPIAFIQQGEDFVPAAVQGLQAGQNCFVTADGRWIGPYVPAIYRGYPFALAQTEDQRMVLCIDHDSGLVAPDHPEPFFDEQGQPTQAIKNTLNFLEQVQADRNKTRFICAVLQQLELIKPWHITLKGEAGEEKTIQGLYCIDEARLNALDAEALHRLKQSGGLPVVYTQLLSMQHLNILGKLTDAHAMAKAQNAASTAGALPTTGNDELDLEFLNKDGTLNFGPH